MHELDSSESVPARRGGNVWLASILIVTAIMSGSCTSQRPVNNRSSPTPSAKATENVRHPGLVRASATAQKRNGYPGSCGPGCAVIAIPARSDPNYDDWAYVVYDARSKRSYDYPPDSTVSRSSDNKMLIVRGYGTVFAWPETSVKLFNYGKRVTISTLPESSHTDSRRPLSPWDP